jgi:hypothetical protein
VDAIGSDRQSQSSKHFTKIYLIHPSLLTGSISHRG